MITENLSTLKIHKLTQEQYERELNAGNIDETALYLTPDDHILNTENPHNVTAEQIGALPVAGGAMEDTLTLRGVVLTPDIDFGVEVPSYGTLGQLYFKKVM